MDDHINDKKINVKVRDIYREHLDEITSGVWDSIPEEIYVAAAILTAATILMGIRDTLEDVEKRVNELKIC